MLRISHAALTPPMPNAVFLWKSVRRASLRADWGPSDAPIKTGSRANEGLFLEGYYSFMLSFMLHVCSKHHSGGEGVGGLQAKLLIHVQEENNKVN